ncbi:hypothetical protein [Streptomyces vietnamensis]|uniref:hypothetical protein n=1 Tax=Streptomyces vietnamensis TaxID=362257 RepID=UPI000A66B5BC|nr:hypothetical protein [Streptomyces vietnamensis]
MEINNLVVRRAVDSDAAAVAEVWPRSFAAALPSVRRAHTDDQVRAWFREMVVPGQETWVATVEDSVVAMVVLDGEDLDQLRLAPAWQGQGIDRGAVGSVVILRQVEVDGPRLPRAVLGHL